MYRTILVPLDQSLFAEHALPLALTLARRTKGKLHLVLVHVPPLAGLENYSMIDEKMREDEHLYLEGIAHRLAGVAPVDVSCEILNPPIANAIDQQARLIKADLTVMTTHGRGPLARFWLGSVADRLVRSMSTPILLIRPHEKAIDPAQNVTLQHILIPLDGSMLAEQILEPAMFLGSVFQADFQLVRVVDPLQSAGRDADGFLISGLAPEGLKRLQEEAEAYLEKVADRFRSRSLQVETRLLVSSQKATAILEHASSTLTDVIALETHGHGGLTRFFLGSVSDKVLRGTTVPVLVHRPLSQEET
jgi:nucleotide-binding universal stress UspA family protein